MEFCIAPKIAFSDDNGHSILEYSLKASNRLSVTNTDLMDLSLFIGYLCETANSKEPFVLVNTNTNDIVCDLKTHQKYYINDFILTDIEGINILFDLTDEEKNFQHLLLRNIKKIEANSLNPQKCYVTSDTLKDDVLGFIFK